MTPEHLFENGPVVIENVTYDDWQSVYHEINWCFVYPSRRFAGLSGDDYLEAAFQRFCDESNDLVRMALNHKCAKPIKEHLVWYAITKDR